MRKTVWKLQNMSKNRFLQGKHHLVPAVLVVDYITNMIQIRPGFKAIIHLEYIPNKNRCFILDKINK